MVSRYEWCQTRDGGQHVNQRSTLSAYLFDLADYVNDSCRGLAGKTNDAISPTLVFVHWEQRLL
jgi:hypothetical protein